MNGGSVVHGGYSTASRHCWTSQQVAPGEHFGPTTVVNCGLAASGYYTLAEVGEEVKVELRRAT